MVPKTANAPVHGSALTLPASSARPLRIVIIGAGFGGIGAAIRCRQAGFDDVMLIERGHDVGGVWRDNTYPGCACDVQSHLYSFSFAPNPTWTRAYSRQPEILAYLRRVADDFGVRPLVRFHTEVRGAVWRDNQWHIEIATRDPGTGTSAAGVVVADVLIGAQGALSEPVLPQLEGLEKFAGKTMHSARWDHTYSLEGKRVAVVGTGASAIQFVPAIQPKVARLTLFQRTPPWVLPRHDGPIGPAWRSLYAKLPLTQKLARGWISAYRELLLAGFVHPRAEKIVRGYGKKHLRDQVPNRELRKKLTPKYAIGCKRILVSDDYLPALTQPNVDVVTDAIVRVTERGVVDAAGREHEVDCIIFGTGFSVTDPPIARFVKGRDGRSLTETWGGSMSAHVGTTVHGFPNFFMVLGPNTGLGHTSVIKMMESQYEHIVGALAHVRTHASAIEPTAAAQQAWLDEIRAREQGTVWVTGGCASWYLDATGRNSTLWPSSTPAFHKRVAPFHAHDYSVVAALPAVHPERALPPPPPSTQSQPDQQVAA